MTPPTTEHVTARFTPGEGIAFVGARSIAVVLDDADGDVSMMLDDLIDRAVGFDDLSSSLIDLGLTRLPDLAVAVFDGDTVRALVRGRIEVTLRLTSDSADVVVDATSVRTWVEIAQDDVHSITLGLERQSSVSGPFRIGRGVVPVANIAAESSMFRPPVDHESIIPPPADHDQGDPAPTPTAHADISAVPDASAEYDIIPETDVVEESGLAAEPETTAEPEPTESVLNESAIGSRVVERLDSDGAVEPSDLFDSTESDPVGTPEAIPDVRPTRAEEDEGIVDQRPEPNQIEEMAADHEETEGVVTVTFTEDPTDWSVRAVGSDPPMVPQPGIADISFDDVSMPPETSSAADDPLEEYDHLFGPTMYRPVSEAGVDDDRDASGTGTDDRNAEAVVPTDPAAPMVDPSADPAPGRAMGDHDGMTITVEDLRRMEGHSNDGAAGSGVDHAPPIGSLPVVHAVSCPSGHPNPPSATACRSCGVEIPQQPHMSVPRPVLGILRFSTGDQEMLDTNMLLGRSPRIRGQVGGPLPRLVKLHSELKELSGTHLEVRIEGWQVLVIDRQSTNGTTVQLPDREPQRLRPGDPFPIVPGATVDMAEEVQFTYEVGT